jgi:hypothetical protein
LEDARRGREQGIAQRHLLDDGCDRDV